MKIRIEGTAEDLSSKGPALIKSLARRLGVDLRQLAVDELQKANKSEPGRLTSKYPPIQNLLERSNEIYRDEIELMLEEIVEVLDRSEV